MSTIDNLRAAFVEETKNRGMYLAFAESAQAEGKPQIARMFRALAESELIHGRAELRLLGDKASAADNVQFAITVEEREFQELYARFLRDAQEEGAVEVVELMEKILKVERSHHELLRKALGELLDGGDVTDAEMFVCGVCGNTVVGPQDEPCKICGASPDSFAEIA